MKKQVLQKIHGLAARAKEIKTSEGQILKNTKTTNSLAENIKSQEQADSFKKLLKAL